MLMLCPKCKEEIQEGVKFCSNCGSNLIWIGSDFNRDEDDFFDNQEEELIQSNAKDIKNKKNPKSIIMNNKAKHKIKYKIKIVNNKTKYKTKISELGKSIYELIKSIKIYELVKSKKIVISLVFILLIVGVSSIYFLFMKDSNSNLNSQQVSTNQTEEDLKNEQNNEEDNENSQEASEDSTKELTYETYTNDKYGFSIDHPTNFIADTPPTNGDGLLFKSTDGTVSINVSGINNVSNETSESLYKRELSKLRVKPDYNALFKKSYAISWDENGTTYYKYYVVRENNNSIQGFAIEYPTNQNDIYAPMIEKVYKSFKPN